MRPPFRYDIVGSFLRPDVLKQARADAESGLISKEALTVVEDESIRDLVRKEKAAGLHAFTDGEFRRAFWHLDFITSLKGTTTVPRDNTHAVKGGNNARKFTLKVTGPIGFDETNPFLAHFKFLQTLADDGHVAKMTIPSPSIFHLLIMAENPDLPAPYAGNTGLLFADLVSTYQEALLAFYRAGCRYLQLDDTSWGEFCSVEKQKAFAERGVDLPSLEEKYVEVLNAILSVKPSDMAVTMHICRGNFRSTWFSSGGYEPVAKVLFGGCHIDGFFLEYDSDRAGDFQPLRYIKDQQVVLGLVTSKTPELEDPAAIKARIQEASQYVPLDQLSLSPQCGFASTEEGNLLREDQQWAKIQLIRDIATSVWNDA